MTKHILFALGQVVATKNAVEFMNQHGIIPLDLLYRHQHGDWGDLNESDRESNEQALIEDHRIFQATSLAMRKFGLLRRQIGP